MAADVRCARLTLDLPVEMERRLRLVAAHYGVSVLEYILQAVEERLAEDWQEMAEYEGLLVLTARDDPVLAELWDNEKDAAYDRP